MSRRNPWYDASKAHHTPDGFCNPEGEQRKPGDLQRWRRERKAQHLPLPPASGYADFSARWYQPADLSGSDDRIWWLGHAALLLRLKQRYILIDPALSPRASPLPFAGPERRVPSPLDVTRLPQLDYVLISHNHYDHLDRGTIKRLLRCFPEVKMIVPLGLGAWCRKRGARNVTEMDWWESADSQDLSITAVPARHWSMRTLWDRNRSLWCGWVVRCGTLNFWFSGDSGYSDNLLQIVQRLGPFNLAALPVGAYAPEWFMGSQHMNPQHAADLWQYAGHPLTIPIHWGVYELADESLDAPPAELQRVLDAAGTPLAGRFSPWRIGESRTLADIE
ncbi:MBL fold metallo-hydrolase [Pantoea sp. ICBG 1758]|jgi:L-ascorbate metabolism protein UlaG (beta-lactamase superfamily)|uniref:MBL fold metallo-hydrolase n=1 Tax=Pantoea TaxID=53335 RepID=UPI000CE386E4|nr:MULTISPECIES: MBL fold metallo-hydrolase [Pantoea]MCL9645608.1 MBL fold metallo-hydrolase [Pantoea eucrina]MDJ0023817.1 MBL fold metallo-hydrolase [Pantoea eucrina]NIE70296.1 MBL fold metallo-hydrolase [Pantoea sp. Acro-807]PPC64242.1 MBL fold metallo-hydrolase [Pantoea sp. ICBG 1758]RAU34397.1 MBL fold metallo-hydrolase [Pantoea sp. RIT 413]